MVGLSTKCSEYSLLELINAQFSKFHLGTFSKLEGKCKQECDFQVIVSCNVLYKGTPDCPFAYIFIYRRRYKYPHTSFNVTV